MWDKLFSKTKYDWPRVLKEKSNDELIKFFKTAIIDIDGKVAAIGEMKSRKINSKVIEELSRSILEDLKSKKVELQRVTLKDKMDNYFLFIQLAILPAFIYFAFIYSEAIDMIPQWVSFTGIVFLVVLSIFNQQHQLKKKQKKKEEEIKKIESQIK